MNEQIEVEYKGKILKGVLVTEDKEFLKIKLSSGYNANVKKKESKILSRNKMKEKKVDQSKTKLNSDLPHITLIHTGGTIASKVDYTTGAVSSRFTPEELLGLYPELNEIACFDANMIGNIFSGDLNFNHQNLMLHEIEKAVQKGTQGIIISHGTDTIQYTAPGLWYALRNLNVPILLVGAQRSSDRPSSDSYLNLRAAVHFILSKEGQQFNRVGLCMHSSIDDKGFTIFEGVNVKKLHSSRRDAFRQINYPVAATVSEKGVVKIMREELFTKKPKEKLTVTRFDPSLTVGFFKSHPNTFPQEIKMLEMYDGVVIEGTGFGHIAVDEIDEHTKVNTENLKALSDLVKKTKVIVGTQCVYGPVALNVYSYGRKMQDAGVLGNHMNLSTETLFMRMAHLLSLDKKKFEENWSKNLEGFEMRLVEIDETLDF